VGFDHSFQLFDELGGGLFGGEVAEGEFLVDPLVDGHDLAGADGRRRVAVDDFVLDLGEEGRATLVCRGEAVGDGLAYFQVGGQTQVGQDHFSGFGAVEQVVDETGRFLRVVGARRDRVVHRRFEVHAGALVLELTGKAQEFDVTPGGVGERSELVGPEVGRGTFVGGQNGKVGAACGDFNALFRAGLTTGFQQPFGDVEPGFQGFRGKGQVAVLVVEVFTVLASENVETIFIGHALGPDDFSVGGFADLDGGLDVVVPGPGCVVGHVHTGGLESLRVGKECGDVDACGHAEVFPVHLAALGDVGVKT